MEHYPFVECDKKNCIGPRVGKCSECSIARRIEAQESGEADVRLNNLLGAVAAQVARLRSGVEDGRIGTRSLVGDVVLDLESILKDHAA
jgi:hypothetical protein